MGKLIIAVYGIVNYLIFQVSWLYSIGFIGNVGVPKSIDSGASGPLDYALLINLALLGLFAVQHSIMARPDFKDKWTKIIPRPAERSTYVLLSSLLLILLFWQWRPMQPVLWTVTSPLGSAILSALYYTGWVLVCISTFMIDHFDFFGLRQIFRHVSGKPSDNIGFKTPALYKYVRHPIMLGFIIAFWSTTRMTLGHLIFALASTGYILIALRFEENDLIRAYGDAYRGYKLRVPMLFPWPWRK